MWAQHQDPVSRVRRVAAQIRCAAAAWSGQLRAGRRRAISFALGALVILSLTAIAVLPRITSASARAEVANVLANGSFEHGFKAIAGCGDVGAGWRCFTNGGAANYGFYADEWEPVVADGKKSQLIEINTKDMPAADNDRYAGLYQTARVVRGERYTLSLRGIIRTSNQEGDPWRYRVQVGYLDGPHGDWQAVENWIDVGWDTYYERTEPGTISHYQTTLTPDADVITVFVRVWKKWGVAYEELDVNLDDIALTGPAAQAPQRTQKQRSEQKIPGTGIGGPVGPDPEERPRPAQTGPRAGNTPSSDGPSLVDEPAVCNGPDLLGNGSFEQGFTASDHGDVGRGWQIFTNGGRANYGFAQEEWDVLVADGESGQLIEISSKSVYPTDADRYAGIYRRLDGLEPGAVYELRLRGELRGAGNDEDAHRFAAQWGLGTSGDWRDVDEWETMDLGPIHPRTQPSLLSEYTVRFRAPGPQAALFIRGWKKWGVTDQEMALNLDAIRVRACRPARGPQPTLQPSELKQPGSPGQEQPPAAKAADERGSDGASCQYVVKSGDTLSGIAQQFGVDAGAITRANGLGNANIIYVGQELAIPGCNRRAAGGDAAASPRQPAAPDPSVRPDPPMQGGRKAIPSIDTPVENDREDMNVRMETYTVQRGDMLSAIAQQYGLAGHELAAYNGIDNMNMLYVGQELRIPRRAN